MTERTPRYEVLPPEPKAPKPQGIQGVGDVLNRLDVGLEQAAKAVPLFPLLAYQGVDYLAQAVRDTLGTPSDEPVLPGAGAIGEFNQSVLQRPYKTRDMTPPDTTGERALELIPSVLLSPMRAPAAAPSALSAALAPLLPMSQAVSVPGKVAEYGIGLAAQEGMANLQGQQNVFTDLKNAISTPPSYEVLPPRTPDAKRVDEILEIQPTEDPDYRHSKWLLGGAAAVALGAGVTGAIATRKLTRSIESGQRDPLNPGPVAPPIGGAVLPSTPSTGEVALPTENMGAGVKSLLGPSTDAKTAAATQLLDSMAPVDRAIDLGIAPTNQDRANQLKSRLRIHNIHGLTSMVDDFWKTGRFPGSDIKLKAPPIQTIQKVMSLTPEETQAFNDLATLGTKINQGDREVAKGISKGTWQNATSPMSLPYMKSRFFSLQRQYPKAAEAVEDLNYMYRFFPEWLEKEGFVNNSLRQELELWNKNYSPLSQDRALTLGQRMQDWLNGEQTRAMGGRTGADVPWLKERLDLEDTAMAPGEVGPALTASMRYVDDMIRTVMINRTRNDILNELNGVHVNGQTLVQRMPKSFQPPHTGAKPGEYIRTRHLGQDRWYKVNDPGLYSAMKWRPRTGLQLIGTVNTLASKVIVGKLNPLFLPRHIQYETNAAISNLPAGRRLGHVDELMKIMGLKKPLLSSFDPTNAVISFTGAGRKLYADFSYSASLAAREHLINDSWLVQTLGRGNVEQLARIAQDAYERSSASLAERVGAIAKGRYSAPLDSKQSLPNALGKVLNTREGAMGKLFNGLTAPGRLYSHLYEALRDGARLQYFASNLKREPKVQTYTFTIGGRTIDVPVVGFTSKNSLDELEVLGAETRALTSDSARFAGDSATLVGKGVQKITDATMFGNSFTQALAQSYRAYKDHPTRWLSVQVAKGTAIGYALYYAASTPGGAELLRQMTAEQRARNIPILNDDGELVMFMNTLPEDRPWIAAMAQVILASTGVLGKGENESAWDINKAFWDAVKTDFLPDFTGNPIAKGVGWALGKEFRGANTLETTEPRESALTKYGDVDNLEGGLSAAQRLVDTTVSASVSMVMDSMMQMYRGLKEGYNLEEVAQTGIKAFTGPAREAKQASILYPLWGVDNRASVANATWKKTNTIIPVIQNIIERGDKVFGVGGAGTTKTGPQNTFGYVPNERGDLKQGTIWTTTKILQKRLQPLLSQYKQLTVEQDKINTNPAYADITKKIPVQNSITEQKQRINEKVLAEIREVERIISSKIGEDFSYEDWQP